MAAFLLQLQGSFNRDHAACRSKNSHSLALYRRKFCRPQVCYVTYRPEVVLNTAA